MAPVILAVNILLEYFEILTRIIPYHTYLPTTVVMVVQVTDLLYILFSRLRLRHQYDVEP
jgi:hypothetical protein